MRKNRGLQDPQLIHSDRDWALGMMGTLTIVCIAVAFSVWQYYSYTNLSLDEEVILDMIPYKTVQVEKALSQYRDLSATHDEIISDTSGIVVEEVPKEDEETSQAEASTSAGTPSLAN